MLSALLALCVGLDVAREIFFKIGAPRFADVSTAIRQSRGLEWLLRQHWPAIGIGVWAIELILWAQVLARIPLNVAVPIMSLTYALVPLAGLLVFGEQVSRRRWIGIGAVTAGAVLVGISGVE